MPTTVEVAGGVGALAGTARTWIKGRGAVSPTDAEGARAYCGPAHGHTWLLESGSSWPPRTMLVSQDRPREYRLIHDLRAHRPARDHLGHTLYMLVIPGRDRDGSTTTA